MAQSVNNMEKKIPLEDLSKEELIKKCRSFLSIIQKAKQSKCLMQEEIEGLKSKINNNSLTNNEVFQKQHQLSTVEDFKYKIECLEVNLLQHKEEKKRLDAEVNKLDNENIAYKRQVDRLSDENNHLLVHLDVLEKQIEELNKIGLEQQKQLLALEESNNNLQINNQHEKVRELEKMLSISLDEIKRLKNQESPHENNSEQGSSEVVLNDQLKVRLKNYHSKIVKLAINIKQLRADREFILDQFKMYTDQVNNWKNKLQSSSDKLLKLVSNYELENEELQKNNHQLKELNIKFMEQLEAHKTDDEKSIELEKVDTLKLRNLKLVNDLEQLKNAVEKISIENNQLKNENDSLKLDLEEVKNTESNGKKEICLENEALKRKTIELELEKSELVKKVNILQETEISQEKNKNELENQIKHLSDELNKSLATEKQLAEKSSEEMLKLVKEIDLLTESTVKLQQEIEEYKQKEEKTKVKKVDADIQTMENDFKPSEELQEEIQLLKNENSQLLIEMNEMNQELKERGENLSKIEAHCEEMKKKIQIHETQANKNVNNITEKEEQIKELQAQLKTLKAADNSSEVHEKDEELLRLKNEVHILKEKLNAAESDVLSTSTISRTEEMDRLRDLEGSWEEKYSKLRTLAIKLKAKLKNQTAELAKEKSEKSDVDQKLNMTTESLRNIHHQYDELSQELKETKQKCLEHTKSLEHKESESNDMKKGKICELEAQIENLKQEKANTDNWKKQIAAKVQALRKELEEKEIAKNEYELKLSKLHADLEAKDQALKIEIESHRQTKNSLQHSANENKKNTVLNLEMQDYEKSVKELSQKLEKKNDHVVKLKGQIDSQKETIASLRGQNNVLEEKLRAHQSDLETAVDETSIYKKKASEFESKLQVKETEIASLNQQLETTRSQIEELSTELSRDIAERQKSIHSLKEEKEFLYIQVLNLQQSNRDLQQKLTMKEEEFVKIEDEYENYKIRAQSVLRQNQNRDIGLEEKLSGNVCSLKSQVETLQMEIDQLRKLSETLKTENETLVAQRESLTSKYEDISKESTTLKEQYNQLLTKYNEALSEHNETVRSFKVHAETLAQCYRQQLSEQEVRHNREIVELQSKLEKTPNPPEVVAVPSLPPMPREEGEGSESTGSVNNVPVSLEKLLNEGDDHKLNILKKQINEQESKLSHLTELLADTEQDLVKHVQMNKVLKEEIRRQQRAVEREKHGENLEYLKNVMFKFMTSNNTDERSRLVPVLNTILKLSPEESRKLDAVSKGDPGMKAWSSYLSMWSSPPNKPA